MCVSQILGVNFACLPPSSVQVLGNVHLYGRHLVFDYAEEDSTLEAVRAKTGRYFAAIASAEQDGLPTVFPSPFPLNESWGAWWWGRSGAAATRSMASVAGSHNEDDGNDT